MKSLREILRMVIIDISGVTSPLKLLRSKLPQWGLGRSPSRQRFRCIL